jgi:tetratricopeptide (TPR) repeat protein
LRADPKSVDSARLRAAAARVESKGFFRRSAMRALAARGEVDALVPFLADGDIEVLQIVCQAFGDQPHAAAVPGLLALLNHKTRTVRVDAAFAAVRAGARGEMFEPALADAREMLVRQEAQPIFLERMAMLAEAVGNQELLLKWVQQLLDLKDRSAVLADLLQRRARFFTEEAMHDDALRLYENAAAFGGPPQPYLSHIDSADSLLAVRRGPEAVDNWTFVTENADKTSFAYLIARARLEAANKGTGDEALKALSTAIDKAASDPAQAEMLRRARWTLRALVQR